jgi:hypothetical protein
VRHGEGQHFDVADSQALAGAEALELGQGGGLGERFGGAFGEVDGDVELGRQRRQVRGMVGVLVR